MKTSLLFILISMLLMIMQVSWAQEVGREAAQKYMKKPSTSLPPSEKSKSSETQIRSAPQSLSGASLPANGYLMLGGGAHFGGKSYRWGDDFQTDTGKWNLGFTYRLKELFGSAEQSLRVDLTSYQVNSQTAQKLSFIWLASLPDGLSGFPLYFGLGLGPGVFLKQAQSESVLSLDYQLVAGIRMLNLVGSMGAFLETGMKNHFLLLSDGQFLEGYFLTAGLTFSL